MNKAKMLVVMLLILAAGATYTWACQGPCAANCYEECCSQVGMYAIGGCSLAPCESGGGCCDTCPCEGACG